MISMYIVYICILILWPHLQKQISHKSHVFVCTFSHDVFHVCLVGAVEVIKVSTYKVTRNLLNYH